MFQKEEIFLFLRQVIEAEKANSGYLKQLEKAEEVELKDLPKYTPVYRKTVAHARELSVHADGVFPTLLFEKSMPNEMKEEFEYRQSIYEPITQSAWSDAMKTTNRIWNRSNFKVEFLPDENDESPKVYFEEEFPNYKSIYNCFETVVTSWTIKDPNAVLSVKPRRLPFKIDSDGNKTVDQTELVEPIAVINPSARVIFYEPDLYLLVLTGEKTKLENDGKEKTGRVFEFYDDKNIWTLKQKGKKEDNKYDLELYYTHDLGYLPCWRLPGIPQQIGVTVFNASYFSAAVPSLNNALIDSSTLQVVKIGHAYPQRWEYVDKCNAEGCIDGRVWDEELGHSGDHKTCPVCKGTGRKSRHSPASVMEVEVPGKLDNPDALQRLEVPPFGYVEPSSAILEFNRSEINNAIERAFMFVNIAVSNSNVKGEETALGKMIDREEQFVFLLKLSNELFDLLEKTMRAIGEMRYMDKWEMPTITAPKNFRIRTEIELTQEIGLAKDKGLDISAVKRLFKEYFMLRFHLDETADQVVNIMFAADRLIGKSDEEINSGVSLGKIAKWEAILHDSVENFIDEQEEGFLDKEDLDEQVTILQDAAKLKATEVQPSTDQSILDQANAQ